MLLSSTFLMIASCFHLHCSIELLEITFDDRAFNALAVVGKNYIRMCWTSV